MKVCSVEREETRRVIWASEMPVSSWSQFDIYLIMYKVNELTFDPFSNSSCKFCIISGNHGSMHL